MSTRQFLKLAIVYFLFAGVLALWFFSPLEFTDKVSIILIISCFLAAVRVIVGPSVPDRALATDIIGLVIIGFCAILFLRTGKAFYMDIAIAWALQSFIGILAIAKYLEGRRLDE